MKPASIFYVAPFKRLGSGLAGQEMLACKDEAAAFRRGKAMLQRVDGMVFFRIECAEDGDVWSRVETLATVGDVPNECAD